MKHLKSSAYSPVSTNLMGQSLIYDHMSSHYRRLYNAKARVDSSPPRHMRMMALKTGCSITPQDMALVYDTKLGPGAYCSQCCATPSGPPPSFASISQSPASWKKPPAAGTMRSVNLELKPADRVNRHIKCLESPAEKPFKPQVLKSNAQSKLRDLRVYHPPRRKAKKRQKVVGKTQEILEPETAIAKEEEQVDDGISSASSAGPWLQMSLYMEYPCQGTTQKSTSEESSRDSAYNGGVSSAGESRGPTPEQSPGKPPVVPVCLTPALEAKLKRQKEEALYVQFVHDITQDVLNSCIFSNKGLRQVFQRHISLNKDKLNMDRMKAEVSKLQIQLDMPDDEEDTFPMPSQEDIVLSWPSTTQYTEDIPSRSRRQTSFPSQPAHRISSLASDSTLDHPVSATLVAPSSPLSAKTVEIMRTPSVSVAQSQVVVDESHTYTALMAPSSARSSRTDQIIPPSLESTAVSLEECHTLIPHSTVLESKTPSESKTESTVSADEFATAEEHELGVKSKVQVIQSLVDMGFAYTMAEEICQSIHYIESQPSPSGVKLKTASEARSLGRKSSVLTRPTSPTLSSIEEITEHSDPPSACYCSYSPVECMPGRGNSNTVRKVGASEVLVSTHQTNFVESHNQTKDTENNLNDEGSDSQPTSRRSSISRNSKDVEEVLSEDRSSYVDEELSFVAEEFTSEVEDEDGTIKEEISEDSRSSTVSSISFCPNT